MTGSILLRACIRYWFVVMAGAAATIALAWFGAHPQPVFYAESNMIFLAPPSRVNPNSFELTTGSLISSAGVIQREYTGPSRHNKTTSASITLVDRGIYDGSQVQQPDTGGQWAENFDTSLLQIEVTGSDPQVVQQRLTTIISDVTEILATRQKDARVSPANEIQLRLSPAASRVVAVRGNSSRALLISIPLGIGVTLSTVALLEIRRTKTNAVER